MIFYHKSAQNANIFIKVLKFYFSLAKIYILKERWQKDEKDQGKILHA